MSAPGRAETTPVLVVDSQPAMKSPPQRPRDIELADEAGCIIIQVHVKGVKAAT